MALSSLALRAALAALPLLSGCFVMYPGGDSPAPRAPGPSSCAADAGCDAPPPPPPPTEGDPCDANAVGAGFLTCGMGACHRRVPACVDGVVPACAPGDPAPEVCNGEDDDCDGTVDEGACRATNDRCEAATALALGAPGVARTVVADLRGAAGDQRPACAPPDGAAAPDVFFRFTVATRTVFYADAFGAAAPVTLFVTERCGAAQPAGFACSAGACGARQGQAIQVLDPGTYYLVVSSAEPAAVAVHVQHLPASAVTVPLEGPTARLVQGNTAGLGDAAAGACGAGAGDITYVFATCPDFNGLTLRASTCGGATWDTVLAVAQGNVAHAYCANDAYGCGRQSTVEARLAPGAHLTTVRVDGVGPDHAGPFALSLDVVP